MLRIINAEARLKDLVKDGDLFCIGFGIATLTPLAQSFSWIQDLVSKTESSRVATGKSGVLRQNTEGKKVRKQPENKVSSWRHIRYFNRKLNRFIEYDREYVVWEKETIEGFQLVLTSGITPQQEIVFYFPMLCMSTDLETLSRIKDAMNMSLSLSSYYFLFNRDLDPIVHIDKVESRYILPSANLSVLEKLQLIEDDLIDSAVEGKEEKGRSDRFFILKEKAPSEVTMGLGGFDDYFMFEYRSHNLMVLENIKTGNATYIFSLLEFDKSKELNKQLALTDPSFRKRLIHTAGDWSRQLDDFFKN